MSAHRKVFLLGPAAAPNFVKGSETTRRMGPALTVPVQPYGISTSEASIRKISRAISPGQHKQASRRSGPSVPACFKRARAPAPALGTRKVQRVLYTVQTAHWGGQMAWWGSVHKNIEIDEPGAAFGGSNQGPWQEVQGRTWSTGLFAAPDAGTPAERQTV